MPLDPPFMRPGTRIGGRSFEATIVRVETDAGLVGVGSGDTVDGFDDFVQLFVGRDALAIERHARVLETVSFHAGRYWPLEAALWDLFGQACRQPMAALLGARGRSCRRTRRGAHFEILVSGPRTRWRWSRRAFGR